MRSARDGIKQLLVSVDWSRQEERGGEGEEALLDLAIWEDP